jgi:hypothetical protein
MTYWRGLLLIFSWRTSEDSVMATFAESTYQEDKRCMLVFEILGADFSTGCAPSGIRPALLLTHPHHAIRRSLHASTVAV